MPHAPRFVPCDYLVESNLWPFSESEVEWILAVDSDSAVQLAWAREQHALAYRMGLLRAKHRTPSQTWPWY